MTASGVHHVYIPTSLHMYGEEVHVCMINSQQSNRQPVRKRSRSSGLLSDHKLILGLQCILTARQMSLYNRDTLALSAVHREGQQ
jgi:hypothetical protein